uniref:Endoplasmic reticulum-Golgi intermediate compartment protein 3 n=1 Tax=Lygus hesperus TaxID=30085 RepID=A0A0A9ZCZ7_LYGHE
MSHTIHTLRFGKSFGESYKPLDGYARSTAELADNNVVPSNAMFTYYAKVVPTLYSDPSHGEPFMTNQFSVTEHQKAMGSNIDPEALRSDKKPLYNSAVILFYELSPIMVHSILHWQPFLHFVTQLCAILGGIFTVAGIVDRLIYGTVQHVQRKVELGKFN